MPGTEPVSASIVTTVTGVSSVSREAPLDYSPHDGAATRPGIVRLGLLGSGRVVTVAIDERRFGLLQWPDELLSDGVVMLDRMGATDIPAIVLACNDSEVTRWLGLPSPYTEEHARQFLDQQTAEAQHGNQLNFAIRTAGTGQELVGAIGAIFSRARPGECEIGYWVAAPVRGQGVARKAIVLLARYALRTWPLRRIELPIEPKNVASRRAAEGAGARFEGVRRAGFQRGDGTVCDVAIYALVPADLIKPVHRAREVMHEPRRSRSQHGCQQ